MKRYAVVVQSSPDVSRGGPLFTAEDLEEWLEGQATDGWELVSFGPEFWRPGSKNVVWIFKRIDQVGAV